MNNRVVWIARAAAIVILGIGLWAAVAAASTIAGGALDVPQLTHGAPGSIAGSWGADAAFRGGASFLKRQPAPVNPRTTPTLRRQRRGTISLGAQGGFGFVRGSSELNDHFDNGLSYAFRFRYMLSSSAALGFSFENQHFKTRAGLAPTAVPFSTDSALVVTTVASEGIVFFHREREFTPYLLGGLGFASPEVRYDAKESRRLNEGPYVVVGAGFERFFRPRVSFDTTLRGYAQMGNSELSMFSQVLVGIHLYPGD